MEVEQLEQLEQLDQGHLESSDDNSGSNATHAVMHDKRTGRQWMVRKRSIEYYVAGFQDLVDRKYKARDSSCQLDILSALGPPAVLEMEDGREFKCLDSFYALWEKKPFSGEPFFDWLDYGSGRELESEACDRERFNRRRYAILNQTEREASRVEFRIETHVHTKHLGNDDKQNATATTTTTSMSDMVHVVFAATQEPVPEGIWLSVHDLNHNLHLIQGGQFPAPDYPFDYWKRGHASVTGGGPVLFAGEMGVSRRGKIKFINPNSGHYRPQLSHSRAFYRWMRRLVGEKVARNAIEWRPKDSATHADLNAWKTLFDDNDDEDKD